VCVVVSVSNGLFFLFWRDHFYFFSGRAETREFFLGGNENDLQLRDLIAKGRVYDVGELVLSLFFLFAFVRSFVRSFVQLLNAP
jgi:hypothetical protein